MPSLKTKVPMVVVGSLLGLVVGMVVGAVGMAWYDYELWNRLHGSRDLGGSEGEDTRANQDAQWAKLKKKMGFFPGSGKGMFPGGGFPGKKGGFGPPASARSELALLVTKLEILTDKPLRLEMTRDEQIKVAQLLQGLDKQEQLTEEDASRRLKMIQEILKGRDELLRAVGAPMPGVTAQPPFDDPNPFATNDARK
jgi:hypothetical protein